MKLTGNIIEKWSEKMVSNAIVSFVVPGQTVAMATRKTIDDGYFSIDLNSGWYDIYVSAEGYEDTSIRLNLFSETHQNIILTPKVMAL